METELLQEVKKIVDLLKNERNISYQIPINSIIMTQHLKNCLLAANINTLEELLLKQISDLKPLRNFGGKSLVEVESIRRKYFLGERLT